MFVCPPPITPSPEITSFGNLKTAFVTKIISIGHPTNPGDERCGGVGNNSHRTFIVLIHTCFKFPKCCFYYSATQVG